jgi:hypothetical protein
MKEPNWISTLIDHGNGNMPTRSIYEDKEINGVIWACMFGGLYCVVFDPMSVCDGGVCFTVNSITGLLFCFIAVMVLVCKRWVIYFDEVYKIDP